ncbi:MAG TPA: helicase HerA-like domain-containing protein, partial [Aquihabitans sp.]|nr:helicase HerA-like domain-containing protein [Aquihabitans sp.]
GEAIVTTLTDEGTPTPVAWTRVRPPQSQIGAVAPTEVQTMAEAGERWATYAEEVDRESARELLATKMGVPSPSTPASPAPPPTPPAAPAGSAPPPAPTSAPEPSQPSPDDLVREAGIEDLEDPVPAPRPGDHQTEGGPGTGRRSSGGRRRKTSDRSSGGRGRGPSTGAVGDFLGSREGRATVNNVVRGVFDLLRKRR